MKEKIKQLLGLNLPNNIVASAVGVDASYISQLLSEEVFAAEVQELRIKNMTESAERDKSYNLIEDKLLEKLENLVDNPTFGLTNPGLLLNAIRTINAAKRRTTPSEFGATTGRQVVPLIMPVIIAQKFVVNAQNQVVEAGGKTIATMSAAGVVKKLEELKKNAETNVEAHEQDKINAEARLAGLLKLHTLDVQDVRPISEMV